MSDISSALAGYRVPGLGYALLIDGREADCRGFGVRNIERNDPVDADTLFAIGSVSKSFTSAAIAMLVDEGKIDWDTRVIDRLPSFRMFDPYVTRELTVRDLLVHRSGLARGDFMWYKSAYTIDEVLARAQHLEPSWGFRTAFGYQNIMYVAAGELIRAASGLSWDEFIKQRILEPLAMNRSHVHPQYISDMSNVAKPHAELEPGTVRTIPHDYGTNSNAAGSIYSSARDMLRWLRFNLGDGTIDGKRLMTSGSMHALHTPQMLIAYASPWSEMFPDASFLSYGYGWFLFSYRGEAVITHSGNIDGMTAVACVVPRIGFGFTALANADVSALPHALLYRALDDVLGGGSTNWLVHFKEQRDEAQERLEFMRRERESARVDETMASRPLSAYTGTYDDAFYGRATVSSNGDGLALQFVGLNGRLEHEHFDVFVLRPENELFVKYQPTVRFDRNEFGEPSALTVNILGALELHLKRNENAEQAEAKPADRAPMLGNYTSRSFGTIAIEELGDTMKVTLPGALAGAQTSEKVFTLVPLAPDSAAIEGTGLIFRFSGLKDGRFAELDVCVPHQMPMRFTTLHAHAK